MNKNDLSNLLEKLELGSGYVLYQLSDIDIVRIRQVVFAQYIEVINSLGVSNFVDYQNTNMSEYHKLSAEFDHGKVWKKCNRILSKDDVEVVKSTQMFQAFKTILGDNIFISSEENSGWEESYWRIVRPGSQDIGSLHADSWFWDLGHGELPEGYKRLKVWIPLYNQAGKNGLRVLPHSQKNKNWAYHGVKKDGIIKPIIDENVDGLDLITLNTENGQAIIFHDDLLHGGSINNTIFTRVSIEMTICYPIDN